MIIVIVLNSTAWAVTISHINMLFCYSLASCGRNGCSFGTVVAAVESHMNVITTVSAYYDCVTHEGHLDIRQFDKP